MDHFMLVCDLFDYKKSCR